ncbi:DNA-binding protein [Bacillus toyonensis]|uniref:DNA-binding protein n=1 Tax=Bacillus toyonensis TaxID=155322 RepID=UPI003D2415DC
MLNTYEINMTTNEVKEYLQISNYIFNNLMQQGRLTPINKDTWRIDGSFLFKKKEVEYLKEEREIDGITLYQASKEFNVSMYQLEKWIQDRELVYILQKHRNRETKFVKKETVSKLTQQLDRHNTINTFSQKFGVVMFQKFINGNNLARIIAIPKRGEIMLIDEFGSQLTLSEAREIGYQPSYNLSNKPRSYHQKFVKFRFPKTDHLRSNTFYLIDLLLQYASPRNIKISEENGFYYFYIRQSLIELPLAFQDEWVDHLIPYIIEGKIQKRLNNSVYLDSSSITKPVTLTSHDYQTITKIVKETNITIEEFITAAIRDKINQHVLHKI